MPNLHLSSISTELSKFNVNSTHRDPKITAKLLDIPNQIDGTYTDDFNILEVHECILKRFSLFKNKNIEKFKKNLEIEESKLEKMLTYIERNRILKNIEEIKKELSHLENDDQIKSYISESELYITSYRKLGPLRKVVLFRDTQNTSQSCVSKSKGDEDTTTRNYRLMIISKYLDIAKKYIKINVFREITHEKLCDACGEKLDDLSIDGIGILRCPCGMIKDTVSKEPVYKDSSRVSTSTRNNYEDKLNFIKAIARYQGKQGNKLPQNLIQSLDEYFSSYGLMTGKQFKESKPLDEQGRRVGTDRLMMIKALRESGNSGLYEDINLIMHMYWGWTLPDISHLVDTIIDDYEKSQKVYENIKVDRSSCLNTQYRLFKHLQRLGYPCRKDEFKIIGTQEILEFYEIVWEKICLELGWEYIKTI